MEVTQCVFFTHVSVSFEEFRIQFLILAMQQDLVGCQDTLLAAELQ